MPGVDKSFKAHSVRGASTLAAMEKGVSLPEILSTKSRVHFQAINRPKTLIMRQRFSRLGPTDLSNMVRTCYRTCYGFHMWCLGASKIQDLFMGSICCAVVLQRFSDTANPSETHELHALYKL